MIAGVRTGQTQLRVTVGVLGTLLRELIERSNGFLVAARAQVLGASPSELLKSVVSLLRGSLGFVPQGRSFHSAEG